MGSSSNWQDPRQARWHGLEIHWTEKSVGHREHPSSSILYLAIVKAACGVR
jgi:hypothetical protein